MPSRIRSLLPAVPANPAFRRMWTAANVSEFGDWSARIILAALIFADTDDPAWVGMVAVAFIAPRLGLGQVLTGWSERMPRKALLIAGDSTRALVFLIASLVDLSPIGVLALVLVSATIDPVFEANAAAATFDALAADDSDDGVRVRQVTKLLAQVGGMGAAGIALRWWSPQTLLIANAASFALSALIIARTDVSQQEQPHDTVSRTVGEAAKDVVSNPHLRAALLTTMVAIFAGTAAEAQVVVVAAAHAAWVLPAASAAGPLAIALAIALSSTEGGTRSNLRRALKVSTASASIAIIALELEQGAAVVVAFAANGTLFLTVAVGQVIAVRHLPKRGRASVLSWLQTAVLVGSALGAAVSGFAINAFDGTRGIQMCLAVTLLAWLIPLPADTTESRTSETAAA